MPYSGKMTGEQLNQRAQTICNMINQLETEWAGLYDKVEQAYADNGIGNSSNTTFEAAMGMPAGWAARIRSFASHALELRDFLDNGAVSSADRRFDMDWFR